MMRLAVLAAAALLATGARAQSCSTAGRTATLDSSASSSICGTGLAGTASITVGSFVTTGDASSLDVYIRPRNGTSVTQNTPACRASFSQSGNPEFRLPVWRSASSAALGSPRRFFTCPSLRRSSAPVGYGLWYESSGSPLPEVSVALDVVQCSNDILTVPGPGVEVTATSHRPDSPAMFELVPPVGPIRVQLEPQMKALVRIIYGPCDFLQQSRFLYYVQGADSLPLDISGCPGATDNVTVSVDVQSGPIGQRNITVSHDPAFRQSGFCAADNQTCPSLGRSPVVVYGPDGGCTAILPPPPPPPAANAAGHATTAVAALVLAALTVLAA